MDIQAKDILHYLRNAQKKELLQYISESINVMTKSQIDDVFGVLIVEQKINKMTPDEVLSAIEQFSAESLAGKYYAPFDMNSKNFTFIPPETDEWFRDISIWLDRACELVSQNEPDIARKCLAICMELIERTMRDDRIVFAHEYGDWMIYAKHDYEAVYKQLTTNQ